MDFDAVYRADPDPWQVEGSCYEQRKLAIAVASLPVQHYRRAWEPGCGPGLVTGALADRVDDLVASDASAVAIELARLRCSDLSAVSFVVSELPEIPLDQPVDLVVAAEFLYYLDDVQAGVQALWTALVPGGQLAVWHWAHHPHDTRLSGLDVHAMVADAAAQRHCRRLVHHREEDFVMDIYQSPEP